MKKNEIEIGRTYAVKGEAPEAPITHERLSEEEADAADRAYARGEEDGVELAVHKIGALEKEVTHA